MLQKLNHLTKVTNCLIIGGSSLQKQEAELRRYPDIVISTPGRIVDHIKNSQSIDFDNLEILVFDEADKLLSMGFEIEIKEILNATNSEKYFCLFNFKAINFALQCDFK
jgi:ATP-dependent RNA helicase DDX27